MLTAEDFELRLRDPGPKVLLFIAGRREHGDTSVKDLKKKLLSNDTHVTVSYSGQPYETLYDDRLTVGSVLVGKLQDDFWSVVGIVDNVTTTRARGALPPQWALQVHRFRSPIVCSFTGEEAWIREIRTNNNDPNNKKIQHELKRAVYHKVGGFHIPNACGDGILPLDPASRPKPFVSKTVPELKALCTVRANLVAYVEAREQARALEQAMNYLQVS